MAALQALPPDYYEAAAIDGAGILSRFRHITYPQLLPLMVIKLIGFFSLASAGGLAYGVMDLVWQGVYTFLVTSTVYYRISGIQL